MQHIVRQSFERSPVIRVGEHVQIPHSLLGKFGGEEFGLFYSVARPDAFQGRRHVARPRETPHDQGRQIRVLVESEENGRRSEAQIQVGRSRLPQRLVGGNEVQ